jgi:hypothetical protein
MKREQLLEAIGGVSEEMLLESEQRSNRSGKIICRIALIAAAVAALTITAIANSDILTGLLSAKNNGSSVSNLSTGMGSFVYSDGYIYYGVPGCIYKSDLNGTVLDTYELSDKYESPNYMFATEDAIIYVNTLGLPVEPEDATAPNRDGHWGLRMQPKDGSSPVSICPGVEATAAYADGDQLYVSNGGEMLSRINLVTLEETELLENVHEYFVDDTYIYAVQGGSETCYFRSRKDVIDFEKIELSFDPNKIIADGEDIYLCQWLDEEEQEKLDARYRVNLVRDGVTTNLPVYSWIYQILDGCVLYLEEETYLLKSYDVSSGETKSLAENVYEFAVLEDRYICIDRFNTDPLILDWETGEYTQLEIDKG